MRWFLFVLLMFSVPAQAVLLAGGTAHALAVDGENGGKVLAWGDNSSGQLGNGGTENATYPVEVFGLANAVGVAAGEGFSLALDSYGYVWAWGKNDLGQLGDTTTSNRNTPVRVSRLNGVVQIAAGKNFALAVKNDGSVWAWGSNAKGQLGLEVSDSAKFRATPVQVSGTGFEKLQKVAAGSDFCLALKVDGSVWAWGANDNGQLGLGNTVASIQPQRVALPAEAIITEIAARNHALALQNNGTVWAWGKNDMGQLGDDTTTQRTAPVQVVDISEVKSIAVGTTWSLALRSDGSVWTWGDNEKGQLLDKTKTQRHFPVKAQGLADIVALVAGPAFAVVGKYVGDILAWGANSGGQLGSGDIKDNYTAAAAVKIDAKTALILVTVVKTTGIASAKASGTLDDFTLTAIVTPSTVDLGRAGFPLVWANLPGAGDFYLTVFGWFPSKVPLPYSGMGPLQQIEIPVVKNLDVRAIRGTKVYAAYGFVPGEGAGQGRTSEIYTVP